MILLVGFVPAITTDNCFACILYRIIVAMKLLKEFSIKRDSALEPVSVSAINDCTEQCFLV
jgi:hypothetical protein